MDQNLPETLYFGQNDDLCGSEVTVMGGSPDRKRPMWQPLGLIGGGLLLFLFAAAGGFSLLIESNVWRILLSAVGLGLVALGGLLLADEGNRGAEPPSRKGVEGSADCQVKMLRPVRFQRHMLVEGGYLNRPPLGSLRLFTVGEDGRFRPQSVAAFDEVKRRWSGKVDLGPGPYYSVYVVVAFVDTAGIGLWDYFYQVAEKTGWELIEGGFDGYVVECDRFLVEGTIRG